MIAIEGCEGYYACVDGHIWSNKYHKSQNQERELRKLVPFKNARGYFVIALTTSHNKRKTFILHRLVAIAHIDNPENKPEVNHINGIKTDNRPCNLEWVTSSENKLHAYRTNLTTAVGERNGQCKLTEEQVLIIRADNRFQRIIAAEYGVSRELISSIKRRKCWTHI